MESFRLTEGWMREQFDRFNREYFGGGLPVPRLSLSRARTRMGTFSCKRRRRLLRSELYDFAISLSTHYIQSERDYQNTLLHEMIHYCIAYTGLKDSSAHGVVFRGMMENLNKKHGWDIRVSVRRGEAHAPDTPASSRLPRLLLAVELADGRHLVSIVNPRYISQLDKQLRRLNQVKTYGWYQTTNPFFHDFPQARSLRGRFVSPSDYRSLTEEATPVGSSAKSNY